MKLTIDGRHLELSGNPTILEAARTAGISIPTLCEHRRLAPYAACRICLVEVAGRRLPAPACATPAEDGMTVVTNSPKIRALRRDVLDLILSEHPAACLVCLEKENCEESKATSRKTGEPTGCILCPADGRCELQKVVAEVGLKELSHPQAYRGAGVRRDDPFIDRDDGLCILCGRCVRVCREIRGAEAIAFVNRGARVVVGTSMDKRLLDVGCRFCGACVDVCPTGALTERAVRYGSKFDETREFVCGLCGQGCRLGLRLKDGRPIEVRPIDGPPSDGQACVKGRFLIADLLGHSKRLLRPLVRKAGSLVETGWDEALAAAAAGLRPLRGSTEVILSAQDSCEDLWTMGRLAREALGSGGFRLAEDTSVFSLGRRLGIPGAELLAPPVTVDDLGKSRAVFVFEEAFHATAPIYGVAVSQALLSGAKLALVGDGEYGHDRCASLRIKTGPAEAGRMLLALLSLLVEHHGSRPHSSGPRFDEFRSALKELKPPERTESSTWKLEKIAALLEKRRPPAFIFGPRFVAGPWGGRNAAALWNLAGLTGGLYVPVCWDANTRGAVEIKALLGGRRFSSSSGPGRKRGLILAGPEPSFKRAGEEFVVVMDAFVGEAVAQADVIFPRTLFAEQSGTFVNNEGRLQFTRAAVAPAGEARPLRAIAEELARALGERIPALKNGEAALKDLAEVIPALAGAVHAWSENRPAVCEGLAFAARGFVDIPDREERFDPTAAYPLRDPDDCLGLNAVEEIKSLRTVRRR
ncbi:MAG: molybdopterin-dependent oxidoreductase [Candidatus Aminicenantes bacterium]|nr:molybdopterin-dependent oxidoreductase [Candidatus Aminicenantes bacterium]